VTLLGLAVVAVALVGQPDADAAPQQAAFTVWAVRATEKYPDSVHYAPGTEDIRTALADLPYDSFELLQRSAPTVSSGKPQSVALGEKYTLNITLVAVEADRRAKIDIAVEMQGKDGKRVSVLESRMTLSPGRLVKLRGLRLDNGELIAVLRLDS